MAAYYVIFQGQLTVNSAVSLGWALDMRYSSSSREYYLSHLGQEGKEGHFIMVKD